MKKEEETTLADRIFSAVMMGGSIGITVGLFPIALALLGLKRKGLALYDFYTGWAFIAVVIISAITGFILGSDKSTTLLGHFWYTETPRNNKISFSLWAGTLFAALIAYS